MFERILVALDGSLSAEQVLGYLPVFCSRRFCRVTVVRIVDPLAGVESAAEEVLLQGALQYLSRLRALSSPQELTRIAATRTGSIAESLMSIAREQRASILVLSTRGEQTPQPSSLGPVVQELIARSPIPLFLMNPPRPIDPPTPQSVVLRSAPGGRLLIVADPADSSEEILRSASEMAEDLDLEALLLQLLPPGSTGRQEAEIRAAAEDRLGRLSRGLEHRGIETEVIVEEGDPAQVVLDVAARWEAGVIAMKRRRFSFDDPAESVLLQSPIPVLLSSLSASVRDWKAVG